MSKDRESRENVCKGILCKSKPVQERPVIPLGHDFCLPCYRAEVLGGYRLPKHGSQLFEHSETSQWTD